MGSTATSHFGTKCPEVRGACQRRNKPQEWGRKPFRGERQQRNGGTHERKFIQAIAARRAQAGRLPLPHDAGAEETGKQPDTPGVLQLRGRGLYRS